jgi:hypothetical protein
MYNVITTNKGVTMIRAIQFSPKRVGSTFLQNAIDSHTDIAGIDEVFVNMAKKPGMRKSGFVPYLRSDFNTPQEYIKDVIYKTYPDKHTIFKLMYNQINFHNGLHGFVVGKIPMIHLMRKNLVKQVVSALTASRTEHKPIAIDADQFVNRVKQADQENKNWANTLKKQIKLTLYYEDIIGKTIDGKTYLSPNANIAVCNFFGVEQQQLFATTKKKNKEDISVYLPNIDKIRKKLKGTEYKWMV